MIFKKNNSNIQKSVSCPSLIYMVLPGVEEQWGKGWELWSFGAARQAACS